MTDLEYLKKQDALHYQYAVEKFHENGDKSYWSNHIHMCDFEILKKLYPKAHPKGWAKYQCKKYLRQFGKKRDECLNCCDECPHMRYIEINDDNFILTIITSLIAAGDDVLNKDMVEKIDIG